MKLTRFLPLLAVCLLVSGAAIYQTRPAAQSEPTPLSWREFEAQIAREDAEAKAAFSKNDKPEKQEKSGAKMDFNAPQKTGKSTTKRSGEMADFIATGAGDSVWNSDYNSYTTYNSNPAYQKDGTHRLWRLSSGEWVFGASPTESGEFGSFWYISSESGSSTPAGLTYASAGWYEVTDPGPTVSAGAPADAIAPTFASAAAVGTTLTINWSEDVTGTTGLSLSNLTPAVTLSGVSTTGDATTATMSRALFVDDVPKLNYTPGNFADAASNAVAAFSNQTVTNASTTKHSVSPAVMQPSGNLGAMNATSEVIDAALLPSAAGAFCGASVYPGGSSLSIANNSDTAVSMTAEAFDSDAFHSTGTNPSRLTIPTDLGGKYLIVAQCEFDANATGYRQMLIKKNGSSTPMQAQENTPSATRTAILAVSQIMNLSAADYLEMVVFQNSGGALTLDWGTDTYFQITRLGA